MSREYRPPVHSEECAYGAVIQCGECEMLHLHIGPVILKVPAGALRELTAMMNRFERARSQAETRTNVHVLTPEP